MVSSKCALLMLIMSVELVSLELTRLTPTGDGAPCNVVPTLFLEDSLNVMGLQDLLFGLHGFLSPSVSVKFGDQLSLWSSALLPRTRTQSHR